MKTQETSSKQPVVWAIDPLEEKNQDRQPLAAFLKKWTKGKNRSILPFSVISPGGLRWPVNVTSELGRDLKAYGKRTVKKDLTQLNVVGTASPEVMVHANSSRRELVHDVLAFARRKRAGFIAINTKSGQSLSPFKLGGFAEAMIARSEIPVLAVGPNAKISAEIKTILFPTDFSEASHAAFRSLLNTAKSFGAAVHLLNVTQNPTIPYAGMDFGASATWIMESEAVLREENQRAGEKWCLEAGLKGVDCEYRTVRTFESKGRAIAKFAKAKNYDLIAMAGYRTKNTPAFLGGTVRAVLASAELPVMEMRGKK